MIARLTRHFLRQRPITSATRQLGNVQVPFGDDLKAGDLDDFGLGDFQYYQDSPEVAAHRLRALGQEASESVVPRHEDAADLQQYTSLREPVVFVSKLANPYLNLAMEDYVYNKMPIPEEKTLNYNRLMFYTNSPCVVIGKNQNPWQEVNLPLLNSLQIPLLRRRSGGGTVVHDMGNVNFSFMTTKGNFDRFSFSNLVVRGLNSSDDPQYKVQVNERGDITTTTLEDGVNYKVSGSAYKLSKGRSYHHGTMLLDLKLDVLRQVLSRDEAELGSVNAMSSIPSVKSKVTNLGLSSDQFVRLVSDQFQQEYGIEPEKAEKNDDEYDQNELFGLTDFVEANYTKTSRFIVIDEQTRLPEEVHKLSNELKEWSWKFGATPKFSHLLVSSQLGFLVQFHVDKHAILSEVDIAFEERESRDISRDAILESFEYLQEYIKENKLTYTGSNVAGFITNDMISDWVGSSIDGTT